MCVARPRNGKSTVEIIGRGKNVLQDQVEDGKHWQAVEQVVNHQQGTIGGEDCSCLSYVHAFRCQVRKCSQRGSFEEQCDARGDELI